jgi:hypothetical protein
LTNENGVGPRVFAKTTEAAIRPAFVELVGIEFSAENGHVKASLTRKI